MVSSLVFDVNLECAKPFSLYRKRSELRRSPLPEFCIGAHAAVANLSVLTRNARHYLQYFPRRKDALFCILFGLCVRYFAEVKGKNAVDFIERGARREISFIPEIAAKECWDCQECFAICPTSYAQAAYFLTEALAFPGTSSETSARSNRTGVPGQPSPGRRARAPR